MYSGISKNCSISLDPALLILGIPPENMTDRCMISLLGILLLIAKETVTASWLKPEAPSIIQWRDGVTNVYIMEKMLLFVFVLWRNVCPSV